MLSVVKWRYKFVVCSRIGERLQHRHCMYYKWFLDGNGKWFLDTVSEVLHSKLCEEVQEWAQNQFLCLSH